MSGFYLFLAATGAFFARENYQPISYYNRGYGSFKAKTLMRFT